MLPFVSKLLIAKQLSFDKGKLKIFGKRVVIIPIELFEMIIKLSMKNKKFEKDLYNAMENSVHQFCIDLNKKQPLKKEDMLEILMNLTEMNGYGEIKIVKIDYEKKFAIFNFKGLPSETLVFEKLDSKTVDNYWGGMLAGGMSYIFGEEVDAIETLCIVTGKQFCEFVVGSRKFLNEYKKKYKIV